LYVLTGSGNVALWVLVVVSLVVSTIPYLYAGDLERARNDPWQLSRKRYGYRVQEFAQNGFSSCSTIPAFIPLDDEAC